MATKSKYNNEDDIKEEIELIPNLGSFKNGIMSISDIAMHGDFHGN